MYGSELVTKISHLLVANFLDAHHPLTQLKDHPHLSLQIHLISHRTICNKTETYQQSIHQRRGRDVPTTQVLNHVVIPTTK